MSALEEVKREDVEDVYELSSSSTNSDEVREPRSVGKRVSPQGNLWEEGFAEKKQKVEPVDDLRLSAWRYEDLKSQAQAEFGQEVKNSVSPVALPFFPQPSPVPAPAPVDESTRNRTSCKQFWKAGDYDGQPSIVRQQAGDCLGPLKSLQVKSIILLHYRCYVKMRSRHCNRLF